MSSSSTVAGSVLARSARRTIDSQNTRSGSSWRGWSLPSMPPIIAASNSDTLACPANVPRASSVVLPTPRRGVVMARIKAGSSSGLAISRR
ncbi:hypothetical protein D3C87_1539710 [compost metagenome]